MNKSGAQNHVDSILESNMSYYDVDSHLGKVDKTIRSLQSVRDRTVLDLSKKHEPHFKALKKHCLRILKRSCNDSISSYDVRVYTKRCGDRKLHVDIYIYVDKSMYIRYDSELTCTKELGKALRRMAYAANLMLANDD